MGVDHVREALIPVKRRVEEKRADVNRP